MGINSKIAKLPFPILYIIMASLILFNWVGVILFQRNFEVFKIEQPWDYYLSNFFSNTFGISQQQYFIFALPVILILLYLIPKFLGYLINLDKKNQRQWS
jgi:hypothetical protein